MVLKAWEFSLDWQCTTSNNASQTDRSMETKRKEQEQQEGSWWEDLIAPPHCLGLGTLGEIGGEPEPPLRILDDPAKLPPSPERFLGRVLRFHNAKVLVEISLHLFFFFFNYYYYHCRSHRPRSAKGKNMSKSWAKWDYGSWKEADGFFFFLHRFQ